MGGGGVLVMAYTAHLQAKDLHHQCSVCQPLAVNDGHSRGTGVCCPASPLPNRHSESIYTSSNVCIIVWHHNRGKFSCENASYLLFISLDIRTKYAIIGRQTVNSCENRTVGDEFQMEPVSLVTWISLADWVVNSRRYRTCCESM